VEFLEFSVDESWLNWLVFAIKSTADDRRYESLFFERQFRSCSKILLSRPLSFVIHSRLSFRSVCTNWISWRRELIQYNF
jgi:hypothetical protein